MNDSLAEIRNRAVTLLSQIAYGPRELLRAALEPTAEDYQAVFVGPGAKQAADFYASFWANPPEKLVKSVAPQIQMFVATAETIVESNEFPGGYRKIAHLLVPGQLWCRWKFVSGTEVIAYDGLVSRGGLGGNDERWAWFPKPWRMLAADRDTN